MLIAKLRTVRVALVTADPVSRAGIAAELESCPDLQVLDSVEDADVAVLVVDQVDEETQVEVRRIRRTCTQAVVMVATEVDDQGLFAAVEAGVTALVRRAEATTDHLREAIREAQSGNGTMPRDLLGRLMQQVNNLHDNVLGPQGIHLHGMSDREVQVLRLVADGMSTSEIARDLSYSERTIKNVIHDVTTRLGLRNRSHAVAFALRRGLI